MVEDLSALVYETDAFPSTEKAKEILAEEGIDTTSLNSWASEKLKGIKARQRMALARERRLAFEERFKTLGRSFSGTASALRKKVLDKIRILGESDPEGAQVFCRKFEDVPDEDLADLDAELSLLEELEGESEGFDEKGS
ncbi:hypothetical protein JIN84_08945 [Luteolibacter yonseiensis]|uniref:Uncharacterized protein n=2 Tax=Luteolibacter yonseiensis TaxID=1144680 RepID=A0A934R2R1_9BACT|nr:hypothetical protein [Luteolibacter yonseiensis]MBK1815742.1 hypothetical protein [Luteolibacter yonseiensis]